MDVIEFKIRGTSRKVKVPASWNELSKQDLLLIYSCIFHNPGSETTLQKWTSLKMISIAKHLLGLDEAFLTVWENDCIQSDPEDGQAVFYDELRQVVHTAIGGLFEIVTDEDGNTMYSTKLNLTVCPYPELMFTMKQGKREVPKWLYAPGEGLGNITIYELGYLWTMFENYIRDDGPRKELWVNELIAAMYRPSRPRTKEEAEMAWGGDRRTPLRRYEAKVEERIKLMGQMNVIIKRVILFWFTSCRQAIVDQYPQVFKRASKVGWQNRTDFGWAGVLLALSGGVAHLNAVSDQHYSNALTWLAIQEDATPS